MNLITELENEFATLITPATPSVVIARVPGRDIELRLPQLGRDFLAGLNRTVITVIPLSTKLQIRGPHLPVRTDQSLVEFLIRQRTPIRLRLSSQGNQDTGWLLNVDADWIRVAMSEGISWVPLGSIEELEIMAVDNLNH
jgi:hypothetical protein